MQFRKRIRRHHVLIAAALAIATLGMPIASGHGPFQAFDNSDVRTIVLTARDMRFNGTNPVLEIMPGEMICIVLRNQDPGMKHDLVIPALGLRTPILEPGEEAVLEFRAPAGGALEYFCSMHPISMKGFFQIGNRAEPQVSAPL